MEELKKVSFGLVKVLLAVILCSSMVFAGDIVHQDDVAPKKPGCENNFVLWVVLVVEIWPKLLSGELERFLLEDIAQVGDVVLIEGESVMENEIKMIGLETLVGYNVVTPGQQNIGKVYIEGYVV